MSVSLSPCSLEIALYSHLDLLQIISIREIVSSQENTIFFLIILRRGFSWPLLLHDMQSFQITYMALISSPCSIYELKKSCLNMNMTYLKKWHKCIRLQRGIRKEIKLEIKLFIYIYFTLIYIYLVASPAHFSFRSLISFLPLWVSR